jgi:hypothetical protein
MASDIVEKVTTELETILLFVDKSYTLGVCKDDFYYDDFGQPWADYSGMHEYAYAKR